MLGKNLEHVRNNIEQACIRANRDIKDVTLLAVSKTKPIEAIYEAIEYNQYEFGENKVQEIINKYDELNSNKEYNTDVKWHMIGHLQTNKVNIF